MKHKLIKLFGISIVSGIIGLAYNNNANTDGVYTVKRGDTFSGIHRTLSNNIPFSRFKELNKHVLEENGSYDRLDVGDKVKTFTRTQNTSYPSLNIAGYTLDDILGQFIYPSGHGRKTVEQRTPSSIGFDYEDVVLETEDNLKLSSYFILKKGSNKAILLLHGNGNDKSTMLKHARFLFNAGYSIMSFDFRGQGKSEGEYIGYGATEHLDVKAALDFLTEKGYDKIGVLGTSLGGGVGIISASKYSEIDALVVDGGFADLNTTALYYVNNKPLKDKKINSALGYTAMVSLKSIASLKTGINYFVSDPVDYINEITNPIFIIHGAKDTFIPVSQAKKNFETAQGPRTEWIIRDKYHCSYLWGDVPGYEQKVTSFFNENLN
jgi:uncharacterized protein